MWQDPIVTEVRKARDAHAAQYNFDLRVIYKVLREQEQANPSQKISLPPKLILPVTQAVKSATAT